MNESERLADQLTRALNGGAWYGPSWREALEGITREAALYRPIPEAHTIAEILLHATTWHDVVRRRLEGESPEVSDTQDWPTAARHAASSENTAGGQSWVSDTSGDSPWRSCRRSDRAWMTPGSCWSSASCSMC